MTAASADNSAGLVSAALLVIGDEILSGRTKDKNIGYIAEYLTNIGIDLREVRVVADVEEDIVAALNALRARYDHVFTYHNGAESYYAARGFRAALLI